MITRRSLFGLTFGGAVATALPPASGTNNLTAAPAANPSASDAPPMRVTIAPHGHACKVEIAGIDVSGMCRSARIYAEAGEITRLHLDIVVLKGSEIVVEPGAIDVQVRNLSRRLRFEADSVRVKADV